MTKKDIPVIKLFSEKDHYFCYDASTNILFSLTKEQYAEAHKLLQLGITNYCRYATNTENNAAHDILFLLNSEIYFRKTLFSESLYPDLDILPDLYERGLNDLILQVTRDCNFACRYCQFASSNGISRIHEKKHMDFEIAKRSVDFVMKHSVDAYKVNISFYGGEPLLNIKLIENLLEYISNKYPLKLVTYNMTVNASLLNDSIIKVLKKHNVNLMISFDGPESVQNHNRKFRESGNGSFQIVWQNICKLRENYKKYFDNCITFHAVVMNNKHRILAEGFFEEKTIPKDKYRIVYADLSGIDYYDYCTNNVDASNKLVENKTNTSMPEWYNNRLKCFNMKYKIPSKWQHNGPCIPGIRRLFVDIEGKFYLCEKAIENKGLSIGSIENGIDISSAKNLLNLGKLTRNECKTCYAFRFCSICAASCIDPISGCITAERKKIECNNQRKLALDFLHTYAENKEKKR